jgi:transketolase
VLGTAPRIGAETASGFGWEGWLGNEGIFIGMSGFGASAPCEDLYKHFGITADAIVAAVSKAARLIQVNAAAQMPRQVEAGE